MQNEYNVAIAGLRLLSKPSEIRSLPYQGDVIAIDGQAVAIGADGETCTNVTADSTDFGVIVFHHIGKSGRTADGKAEAYVKFDVPPVMTVGRVWVKPNEPITARGKAAKVYVNTTDGTLGQTAEGATEWVGAYWDVLTNNDGLAVVNLG